MHILTRRSQRDDGWFESSMRFLLYAQLELNPEEEFLFKKYSIADRVVYNSAGFLEQLQAADEARDEAAKDDADLWTVYYNSFAALYHNIAGKLELQITLQNLIDGLTTESQDIEEILFIENLVRQGVEFIAQYFELAFTFDSREELHEY
jgi:hypothetical protein